MMAAFGTLTFLATLWLLVVVGAAILAVIASIALSGLLHEFVEKPAEVVRAKKINLRLADAAKQGVVLALYLVGGLFTRSRDQFAP